MTPMSLPAPGSPNLASLHAALPWRDDDLPGEERFTLLTADGVELMATQFDPPAAAGPARAVALVAPATGVPQGYYAAFARWLAQRGYAVFTVDYRGLGASQAAPQASMRDWMLLDLPALLRIARRRARTPDGRVLPVLWIGHSLGGHALTVLDGVEHVDAVIGVGAQLPAFHRWPWGKDRWGARFFFKTWLPLCVRWFGRLPGWAMGGGLALPGPAALDWSRWGQMENYLASDPAMQGHWRADRFRGVAQFWCVQDDWVFGPEPAVRALQEAFAGAPGQASLERLVPRDVGMARVGHFGPFRRSGASRIWPTLLERIEAAVPALRAQ